MGEVINLFSDDMEFIAVCPECGYEAWEIILDSPIDYRQIKTIRCAECGYQVTADIKVGAIVFKEEGA